MGAWDLVYPGKKSRRQRNFKKSVWLLEYWELEKTVQNPDWCVAYIHIYDQILLGRVKFSRKRSVERDAPPVLIYVIERELMVIFGP